MNKILIAIFGLCWAATLSAQTAKVKKISFGDIIGNQKVELLHTTKYIDQPTIIFKEKSYEIRINRFSLISQLRHDSTHAFSHFAEKQGIALRYLKENRIVRYNDFLSGDIPDTNGSVNNNLKVEVMTFGVVKAAVCALMERGEFEIYEGSKQIRKYFQSYFYLSDYFSCNCYFTKDKRLISACFPCTSETPAFD